VSQLAVGATTSSVTLFNKHFDGDGMIVFEHACALGCEGIVSSGSARPTSFLKREPLALSTFDPNHSYGALFA
jgi:hypothetical protein